MVYPPQSTSSWSIDQCMELFARYQRRLYLYILSMVPNPTDAEEGAAGNEHRRLAAV